MIVQKLNNQIIFSSLLNESLLDDILDIVNKTKCKAKTSNNLTTITVTGDIEQFEIEWDNSF